MIERHDVSFEYSDDPAAYRRGRRELYDIVEFTVRNHIGEAVFNAVWNDVLNERFNWRYNAAFLRGAAVRREHAENIQHH
jgi:hypothetical protein